MTIWFIQKLDTNFINQSVRMTRGSSVILPGSTWLRFNHSFEIKQTVRLPTLTAVSTDASVVDGRVATIKDSFLDFDSRKFWRNENSASIASTWQVGTNCLCYIYRYR